MGHKRMYRVRPGILTPERASDAGYRTLGDLIAKVLLVNGSRWTGARGIYDALVAWEITPVPSQASIYSELHVLSASTGPLERRFVNDDHRGPARNEWRWAGFTIVGDEE